MPFWNEKLYWLEIQLSSSRVKVSDGVYLPSVVNFNNVKINFLPSLRRDKNNRVFRWNLAQTNVYSIAGE